MAKWLLVGDPHAIGTELEDCRALIDGILDVVNVEKPDHLLFMGDQHHNHRLLDVEVLAFWLESFERLTKATNVLALVGNHDMPGDASSRAHAMMAYRGTRVVVIDKPTSVDGCLLMPYRHSAEQFTSEVLASSSPTVFCHQTLDGAKYENGIYAKDGVKMEPFGSRQFWSGHIHTPHQYGNVTYLGAPRWRSLSDVNVQRGVFLFDVVDGVVDRSTVRVFDTGKWCQRLLGVEVRQGQPIPVIELPSKDKYIVDVFGDELFCQEQKSLWQGCRVRTFKTQAKTAKVTESMGIGKAIQTFVGSYQPKYGTEQSLLVDLVNKRISV